MLIKSTQKFIRTSPRKLRSVSDGIKGLNTSRALTMLGFTDKAASEAVLKTLKTAISDAKNNFKLDETKLKVREILINPGSIAKRGRPVSRGQYHQIKKRTSHITVVLESLDNKN